MPEHAALLVLAALTAGLGTLSGIGGAVLLVPLLVLAGTDPAAAAPLGLLSIAAGSLAAARAHLEEGLVHHRLGVVLETGASAGAVAGALVATAVPAPALSWLLAAVALATGAAGLRRGEVRHRPRPEFAAESAGEWPGTLAGAYRLEGGVVPYQARRVPAGWAAMIAAGLVAGTAGVGAGFIKTPVMREIMSVPVKVAAATSTFTVGLTAAAALIVMAGQSRLELAAGAAVVAGGLIGGSAAAALLAPRLSPVVVRRFTGGVLVLIALVLAARA